MVQRSNRKKFDQLVAYLVLAGHPQLKIRSLAANFFEVNGVKVFNQLPPELRNYQGTLVLRFKTRLDKFLEKIHDKPNHVILVTISRHPAIVL